MNAIGKVITQPHVSSQAPLFSTFWSVLFFCLKNNEDVIADTSKRSTVIYMSVGGFVF